MSETIMEELHFFLHAAVTGVVLSAVYDGFRILRRVCRHGWFWVAVEDFFYWVLAALYISFVLMKDNDGIIRCFFIIGIVLGMFLYNVTISQHLVNVLSKIISKLLNIVEKLLKVLCRPMAFVWKRVQGILKKCKIFHKKVGKKSKKALKKCCKTIRIGLSRK